MKTDLGRVNRVIYYVLLSFFETSKQDEWCWTASIVGHDLSRFNFDLSLFDLDREND